MMLILLLTAPLLAANVPTDGATDIPLDVRPALETDFDGRQDSEFALLLEGSEVMSGGYCSCTEIGAQADWACLYQLQPVASLSPDTLYTLRETRPDGSELDSSFTTGRGQTTAPTGVPTLEILSAGRDEEPYQPGDYHAELRITPAGPDPDDLSWLQVELLAEEGGEARTVHFLRSPADGSALEASIAGQAEDLCLSVTQVNGAMSASAASETVCVELPPDDTGALDDSAAPQDTGFSDDGEGCEGCSSAGTRGAFPWLLLPLGLLARRRRRVAA